MNAFDESIASLRSDLDGALEAGDHARQLELGLQLGLMLVRGGHHAAAEEELALAAERADPTHAPREHATALNLLGVVCRDTGRPGLASELFTRAADGFERAGATAERGAALHNVGLTWLDRGEAGEAIAAFRQAASLLDRDSAPAQTASNLRELGAALLTHGDLGEARELLAEAADLAGRAGDPAGEGAAANALGLAHLAADEPVAAVAAFDRAVAASPRTLRPAAYAMASANLALAHEAAGEHHLARLAAAQAVVVPEAPEPVIRQGRDLLDRLGRDPDDLHRALDAAAEDGWEAVVRREVDRWTLLGDGEVADALGGWVDGLVARRADRVERSAVLMGRYLELPPPPMERLVRALVARAQQLDAGDHDLVRQATSRSLARFPMPQWMRLRAAFHDAAGGEGWG